MKGFGGVEGDAVDRALVLGDDAILLLARGEIEIPDDERAVCGGGRDDVAVLVNRAPLYVIGAVREVHAANAKVAFFGDLAFFQADIDDAKHWHGVRARHGQ